MKNFINIHVLQSVAPSNLNRDESGRPKTATYGGVLRHRVSSQSWKRAMRMYFKENAVVTSYRTKNIADLIAHDMLNKNNELDFEESKEKAILALKSIGWINKSKKLDQTDALSMISPAQISLVADIILDNDDSKDVVKSLKTAIKNGDQAIDIALFGRMVATDPNLNIEGSTMVAHAISTHGIEEEFDYYTATDDFLDVDDSGAGMIGDLEFTSSTLYRYAALNIDLFRENLGEIDDESFEQAIKDFVKGFIYSMPSGKQNSFATPTFPSLIVVSVGDSALSYANAFETPVESNNGYVESSIEELVKYVQVLDDNYNLNEQRTYVSLNDNNKINTIGDKASVNEMLSSLHIINENNDENLA